MESNEDMNRILPSARTKSYGYFLSSDANFKRASWIFTCRIALKKGGISIFFLFYVDILCYILDMHFPIDGVKMRLSEGIQGRVECWRGKNAD